jgi:exopolysaccharide biosynthesis protein
MLDKAGDLSVVIGAGTGDDEALAGELLEGGATQVWAFGPVLVEDGAAAPLDDFKLIKGHAREPRTAIGQIGPLHYVAVVADGRNKNYSLGMTLPELQQVFLIARAQIAFNLDGGGSSTLYFNGEVLNRPAGGVERSVSDILLFN